MFFDQVEEGRFHLVTSAFDEEEVGMAPRKVQDLYHDLSIITEIADVSREALRLQKAYLDRGIVTSKWSRDALHVALATTAYCDLIVSWNFRHIVHFQKIPLYNAINVLEGYTQIAIFSPLEVLQYEDEDV